MLYDKNRIIDKNIFVALGLYAKFCFYQIFLRHEFFKQESFALTTNLFIIKTKFQPFSKTQTMRRFLLSLFTLTLLFPAFAFADSVFPFTDVSPSDSIYNDLSYLYSQGVIKDTRDHLFHPDELMPRDEFVGIAVEISCQQCEYPSGDMIAKYTSDPFLDVPIQNPYFYCVSYAKEHNMVQGYFLNNFGSTSCQDGQKFNQVPFCPANNITRIEAAAALLRQVGLWSETQNANFTDKTGIADVDNYWYGYAKKGLQAGMLHLDGQNKLYPNEYIKRREFVEMAAKIYALNSCEFSASRFALGTSALQLKIFDPKNQLACHGKGDQSALNDPTQKTYSLYADYYSAYSGATFNWTFTNNNNGTVLTASGQCLPDYTFPSEGLWIVHLQSVDSKGQVENAYGQIYIAAKGNNTLFARINAFPLLTTPFTPVHFGSTVTG